MSKFAPYPVYASTSVGWLNEIPSHWRVKPLWSLFRRIKRSGHESERLLSVYRDYGVIPKDSRDDNHNRASEDLSAYQLVEPGDLAINKMKAWQGSVGISGHRGIVSPAYFIFKAEHKENPRYIHHLMRCNRYIAGYQSISKGIRVNQWDLDPDKHARMPVVLPPSDEQQAIVDFLDHETARIDTLITKKTRFIDLLKEKRQAVITKAVTKGLDDSVEMKESGLKWLGNVPRHWSVMACKYGCSLIKDGTHLPPPRVERGIPLLSVRNVQDGNFDFRPDDSMISESDYHELCRSFKPKANDVLLAIVGATIGKTAVVPENMGLFHLQRSLAVFRVKKKLNHLFLNFIFQSAGYQQLLWENIGFSAQPGVYLGALSSFRIPVPPLDEQLKIVEYVIDKTQRTDMLIAKTERSVELLKEHRAALITAAVTGKIDVREAA